MTHFYRRSKVDRAHPAIVAALRKAGVSVMSLASQGDGCPDLLCSYLGRMTLLEVKTPGEKLRPSQVAWVAKWDPHSPVEVVQSVEEALLATRNPREDARAR